MEKVYVVCQVSDNYGEGPIIGVYDSKEKADKVSKIFEKYFGSDSCCHFVSEYEIDKLSVEGEDEIMSNAKGLNISTEDIHALL